MICMIGKLTPASKCFHLHKNHSLISRWIASDERFMKVDFLGNDQSRILPFTIASAKVEGAGKATLTVSIERGWNVDATGDEIVGFATESLIEKRLCIRSMIEEA